MLVGASASGSGNLRIETASLKWRSFVNYACYSANARDEGLNTLRLQSRDLAWIASFISVEIFLDLYSYLNDLQSTYIVPVGAIERQLH